jgi:small subunit ribosomal protein S1
LKEFSQVKIDETQTEITFADLLAEYEPTPLERGQYVTGEVLEVGQYAILADVDAKRTAVVPPQDIANVPEEVLETISIGDEVLFYVTHTPIGDEDLLVSLQKGLQYQDWIAAEKFLENKEMLRLPVIGHNKGGILVEFGHLRGFIPNSHLPELQHIYDKKRLAAEKTNLIGRELPLKILEANPEKKRLVFSAKEARREARRERLQELQGLLGETITGTVTNLVKFGAFIDLNRVEGLVHIPRSPGSKSTDPATICKSVRKLRC